MSARNEGMLTLATPARAIGKLNGVLLSVRADDLAALPLRALIDRNPDSNWTILDDVILGCANQAGEDNRNVARMAAAGIAPRIIGAGPS